MILTVGHSAHPAARFAELLISAGVEIVLDVRRRPWSGRHPQFRREELERWLPPRGVSYSFEGEVLGGQRGESGTSRHPGLDPGLASYADHMATGPYLAGLRRVVDLSRDRPVAVMCAEADPRRCHRWLLADALTLLLEVDVAHLFPNGSLTPHQPSRTARIEDGTLVYDLAADRPLPFV